MDFILASFAFILGIVLVTEGTWAGGMFVIYLAVDKYFTDSIFYTLLEKYGYEKFVGSFNKEEILDDEEVLITKEMV